MASGAAETAPGAPAAKRSQAATPRMASAYPIFLYCGAIFFLSRDQLSQVRTLNLFAQHGFLNS
jgi:hypothetical protein